MRLLDKITGKKSEAKKPAKSDNVLDMVKEAPAKSEAQAVILKDDTGRAHRILLNYHLSEKSNLFATTGRYVFKVSKDANKIEVKRAVEKVYDVHVSGVNMISNRGKKRRMGRTHGQTSDWKKAIVTLKSGEKITGLAEGI